MDREVFREFLRGRKTSADKIESFVAIADEFERFLGESKLPAKDAVLAFSMQMIRDGENMKGDVFPFLTKLRRPCKMECGI